MKKSKIKLVSWNVNGIRACAKKKDGLLSFLEKNSPNIFCVQETKAHIDQVEPNIRTLGFEHAFWSSAKRKGYSGVATFSHEKPQKIQLGIDAPEYDTEGRFVITQHEHFDLYNLYFPNGGSGEERQKFKEQFLADFNDYIKKKLKEERALVIVGDYNVAHTEIDIYDPVRLSTVSGFLPQERAWFQSFLDLGFVDTFRFFHKNEKNRYSWWSYRDFGRVDNRGWRLDYICISKNLIKNLKTADILDQVEGSDHCPIVAELEF